MDKVQQALRDRYAHLPPLVFVRSMEKAATNGQLFDLLHGFPPQYPAVWDEGEKRWVHTPDLLQAPKKKEE